jgi:hypothetical protein
MAELRRARTPTSSVSSDAPRVCSASDRVVSAAHDTLQTALRENPHCSALRMRHVASKYGSSREREMQSW